jgi:hypothetical protein
MRQPIFYYKEDVESAIWILETQDNLDHRLCNILWAAKVIAWFQNFIALIRSKVDRIRGRGIATPIQKIISDISNSIKSGRIFINPIMLMI